MVRSASIHAGEEQLGRAGLRADGRGHNEEREVLVEPEVALGDDLECSVDPLLVRLCDVGAPLGNAEAGCG